MIVSWLHTLWPGLKLTIFITLWVIGLSILWSLFLSILSITPVRILRFTVKAYTELLRSIPLLALLFFAYYGMGGVAVRYHLSTLWLGIGSLVLSESAYLAEIYRATLQSVTSSQWEAGRSLGLTWSQVIRRVVLPQFALPAIPSTLNMMIAILKDTSLLSIITISELTLNATQLVSVTFRPLQIYLLIAGIYLAMVLPIAYLAGALEVRLSNPREGRKSVADRVLASRRAFIAADESTFQ
jgi:His/Glu/Gln/Arg/opine family amino acid ABC transporter permease subunit